MLVLGDQPASSGKVLRVLYCRAISTAIFSLLFPHVRTADHAVVPPSILFHWYSTPWSNGMSGHPEGSSTSSLTYCPELKPLVLLTCVTLPIAAPLSLGFLLCCWNNVLLGLWDCVPRTKIKIILNTQWVHGLPGLQRPCLKQIKTLKNFGGPVDI